MNSYRVLLVDGDGNRVQQISSVLADAHHTVLKAAGFREASEALDIERFDAVLLGSTALASHGLADFAAKLRQMENRESKDVRTPVLCCGSNASAHAMHGREAASGIDAYLPEGFDAETLSQTIQGLATALGRAEALNASREDLPIFEASQFEEQCAGQRDLMVEIIDLYLAEQDKQLAEIAAALEDGDLEAVSRAAHTIKGSLGSLYAKRARKRAEALEYAAKDRDAELCTKALASLENDLKSLVPELAAFRDSMLASQ